MPAGIYGTSRTFNNNNFYVKMIFFDNLFSYQNKRLLTYCLSSEHDLSNPRQSLARGNFLALRQRQRDNVIEPQGQEKIRKIFRSRCVDGVAKQIQKYCNK